MKTTLTLAALALALTACGQGQNASATKDLIGPGQGGYQGAQQVTTLVPTGGSTTLMLPLQFPIQSNALEIHTTCTVQLAQFYATYDWGQVGSLAPSGYSANVWVAPSGRTHNWTAVQFVTNNYGPATYCTYTVKAAQKVIPYAAQ